MPRDLFSRHFVCFDMVQDAGRLKQHFGALSFTITGTPERGLHRCPGVDV